MPGAHTTETTPNAEKGLTDNQMPLCSECGEEPATDVDELCDRCGDILLVLRREA